jgi:hypothetical protein
VDGGIIAGTVTGILCARWKRQRVLMWANAVAPGLFVMQAIARWGNFYNQELYGAPTTLPWGIAIDEQRRADAVAVQTENVGGLQTPAARMIGGAIRNDKRGDIVIEPTGEPGDHLAPRAADSRDQGDGLGDTDPHGLP